MLEFLVSIAVTAQVVSTGSLPSASAAVVPVEASPQNLVLAENADIEGNPTHSRFDEAQFLVEVPGGGESAQWVESIWIESNRVPLIPDMVCYGWRIHIIDPGRVVKFREVFHLPDVPEEMGDNHDRLGV